MIEFVVDSFTHTESKVKVAGAVNAGTVHIGNCFGVIRDRNNSESTTPIETAYSVETIFAYGHELQELPEGMTGELQLTGENFDLLSVYDRVVLVGEDS